MQSQISPLKIFSEDTAEPDNAKNLWHSISLMSPVMERSKLFFSWKVIILKTFYSNKTLSIEWKSRSLVHISQIISTKIALARTI